MGIKNNLIIFLFIIIYNQNVLSQNVFHYQWVVYERVRDGVLIYDAKNNEAVYKDLLSTMRKVTQNQTQESEKNGSTEITTVTTRVNAFDRLFFKKDTKLSYTTDLLKTPFIVDDNTLELKWILSNETKTIDGFSCNKANVNLRGRVWEVWYTTSIPISYGPWKFYGLPGLIITATEPSGSFGFKLTKIEINPEATIPTVDRSLYRNVTFREFDEMEDEVLRADIGTIRSVDNPNSKRRGMELIHEWEEQNKNN